MNELNFQITKQIPTVELGSKECSWVIPENFLNDRSIVFSFGAGEDITWESAIYKKYSCEVNMFDPTPRARTHYNKVINEDHYNVMCFDFYEVGIWNETAKVKFYTPKNKEHVSHSIVNLQKTEDYIEVSVAPIDDLMRMTATNHINMLKLDVEGAEYTVIDDIIKKQIKPDCMLIEFDEVYNAIDENWQQRINNCVKKILDYGYDLVARNNRCNLTFLKK